MGKIDEKTIKFEVLDLKHWVRQNDQKMLEIAPPFKLLIGERVSFIALSQQGQQPNPPRNDRDPFYWATHDLHNYSPQWWHNKLTYAVHEAIDHLIEKRNEWEATDVQRAHEQLDRAATLTRTIRSINKFKKLVEHEHFIRDVLLYKNLERRDLRKLSTRKKLLFAFVNQLHRSKERIGHSDLSRMRTAFVRYLEIVKIDLKTRRTELIRIENTQEMNKQVARDHQDFRDDSDDRYRFHRDQNNHMRDHIKHQQWLISEQIRANKQRGHDKTENAIVTMVVTHLAKIGLAITDQANASTRRQNKTQQQQFKIIDTLKNRAFHRVEEDAIREKNKHENVRIAYLKRS